MNDFRTLDRLATVQALHSSTDAEGAISQAWEDYAQIWVGKEDLPGSLAAGDPAVVGLSRSVFTTRWLYGLTYEMRIAFEDTFYRILSIQEIGRQEGHRIETERMIP